MDDCKIVTDLLPTYCDGLTGWETNTYIRTHLKDCPGCSRLLEQMKQQQERQTEANMRQSQFRAAVAAYEHSHRIKVRLLATACVLLVTVFFVLRACSFDLAIAVSGIDRDWLEVVQGPTADDSGTEFQIVFSRTEEGYAELAYMSKNALGFWTVDAVETATPGKPYSAAQMVWTEFTYSVYNGEPAVTAVHHRIYAGSNAKKSFEQLPREEIPGNVSVLVTQHGSHYYIHVITVLQEGGIPFDVLFLLKENNLIS